MIIIYVVLDPQSMPRKTRPSARKRHSSFSKVDTPSIAGSEDKELHSTETQTDAVKILSSSPEVCTVH